MKKIYNQKKINLYLFFLSLLISNASFSQLINNSFENIAHPDLSFWEWTCGADSFNYAPIDCGSWSIQVDAGNFQGCFPGYAYQKIPSITNGQSFILSGSAYAEVSPEVGIYFGKINNGIITLQSGVLTSSTVWTQISIQSSFLLSAGDTAVVVLWAGQVTGAAMAHGYFDCITLDHETGIPSADVNPSLNIFPNPVTDFLYITSLTSESTMFTITDIDGRIQKTFSVLQVNSKMEIDVSDLAAGIYFLKATDNHLCAVKKFIKL